MQHDSWFFVGIFVFIFLIWIATGGPLHPIAISGPTLPAPGQLGGGTYLSLPTAPYKIGGGSTVSLPGSSSGAYTGSDTGTNAVPLPGDVSPYRGLVSLSRGIWGAGGDPASEYLVLNVASDATVPVDISGWTLESAATGKAAVIPKGTEVPASGIVNAAQDIVLTSGARAFLVSGRSPIGASFRENVCTGYFGSFQTFTPQLTEACPTPASELSSFYGPTYIRDASCIDYVNMLSRCQAVLTPPTTMSGACQSFLVQYLNYNGCVDAHKRDANFESSDWRVYLGRTNALWRAQHESVVLLDANGKLVDTFTY